LLLGGGRASVAKTIFCFFKESWRYGLLNSEIFFLKCCHLIRILKVQEPIKWEKIICKPYIW
jgi:hypothetical protein